MFALNLGKNVTGVRVIADGSTPGPVLKVNQNGPGTGLKVQVEVGDPAK